MNCSESLDLLNKQLDGEAINAGALNQHLRECTACREMHRLGLSLTTVMRDRPRPTPSAELSNRIVCAVLAERRPRFYLRTVVAVSALAASVLVALFTYYSLQRTPLQPPVAQNPPQQSKDEHVQVDVKPSASLQDSVAEASVAMTSLTERLAGETKEHAEILWQATTPIDFRSVTSLPAADGMNDPLAPAAEPLRQAGKGMSQGIETVARSAQRAVDFFFRELGAADKESKN